MMTDDLVARLREAAQWQFKTEPTLYGEAADRIEALESLFPAILEYLEQGADVVDGDNGVPHPNAAMSLLIWTRHALEDK